MHKNTHMQAHRLCRSSEVYHRADSGRRKSDFLTVVPRQALRPSSSLFPTEGVNTGCERYDLTEY